MAKKGLEYVVFGKLQENGTYKEGKRLSPAAAFNGTPAKSNAKDYGDNVLQEVDNSVTGATLSVELNNDVDEIYTYLLGHTKTEGENGEISFKSTDEAPFVGVGAVGMSENKWVVKFYTKVKFSEPNDENQTKQENTTFTHVTLEGEAMVPEDSKEWKIRATFGTLKAAKDWLNKKVGITAEAA